MLKRVTAEAIEWIEDLLAAGGSGLHDLDLLGPRLNWCRLRQWRRGHVGAIAAAGELRGRRVHAPDGLDVVADAAESAWPIGLVDVAVLAGIHDRRFEWRLTQSVVSQRVSARNARFFPRSWI